MHSLAANQPLGQTGHGLGHLPSFSLKKGGQQYGVETQILCFLGGSLSRQSIAANNSVAYAIEDWIARLQVLVGGEFQRCLHLSESLIFSGFYALRQEGHRLLVGTDFTGGDEAAALASDYT